MSNGAPLVLRAAVKPVATLRRSLPSVDLLSGESAPAHIERSDVAILPRAAIVGEAMVALVLADELLATFGGDTLGDVRAAVARRNDVLSRMAKPLDHATDGRLILGLGAGWFWRDFEEFGYEFGTPGERLRSLERMRAGRRADVLDHLGVVGDDHLVQRGRFLHIGEHEARAQTGVDQAQRVVDGVERGFGSRRSAAGFS